MIEVLKHGDEKYIFTCGKCGCKWLAYKNDIRWGTEIPFCDCPECGQIIQGEKVIPQPHRYA